MAQTLPDIHVATLPSPTPPPHSPPPTHPCVTHYVTRLVPQIQISAATKEEAAKRKAYRANKEAAMAKRAAEEAARKVGVRGPGCGCGCGCEEWVTLRCVGLSMWDGLDAADCPA